MWFSENEIQVIAFFIGPVITAAVITGLFNLFLSRKSASLEYITSERGKWRAEIREIAGELNSDDIEILKIAIQKL